MATLGEAVLPMQVEPASKSSLQEFSAREVRYLIGWLGPFTPSTQGDSRMRLYNNQHQFYCGVDLHANSLYVCVVDAVGNKHLHQNFQVRDTKSLLAALKPFAKDLVVACESTFNWYWLCDFCETNKISFILGHALYLKAIHAGKVKNDKIDSEKLAFLLRGGNFAVAYAYPRLGVAHAICSGAALT